MALAFSSGGIGAAFESRNYKLFWWGSLPHSLAAWVYRLAVAWLTWELTRSTVWLGLVAFAHMAPVILLCPLAGATADRYGHKLQYMLAVLGTSTEVLLLAFLAMNRLLTIEILFALAFINGAARTFAMPARQAFIVQLVEPRHISSAIGVGSATFHGANFMGPALAGLIISQFGLAGAFFYIAASGVVAVTVISRIRVGLRPVRALGASSLWGDMVEGFRYTARHQGIRLIMLTATMMTLLIAPYMEMLAAVADRVLGMGAAGLSLLATASGCGAMCGGLWIAWRGRTEGLTRILLAGVAAAVLGLFVFALSTTIWVSLATLFATGFALVCASASASSLVQAAVDPALRARVMSVDAMVNAGAPALGAVVIGWAGAHFGIQAPLAAAALLCGLAWLVLARRVTRQRGALEGAAPQAAQ